MWGKGISYKIGEKNKSFGVSGVDFILLEKRKSRYLKLEKIVIFEEVEVIVFLDQELGLYEIYLVVRYVIIFVVIYFKNFEIRGE